jgi:NitT/TauT family transport system substrate-binding protein
MNKLYTFMLTGIMFVVGSSNAVAQDKLIFSLQWIANGNNFGVFAAKEQGLYRNANLEVDVQRGYGSGETAKRVATGAADMGIADAASVIVGRSSGLKVKQVASLYESAAGCHLFHQGKSHQQSERP